MENDALSTAARIALAMYEGEPCRICGKPITDAANAVFVGYSKDNTARAAHHDCAMDITELVERQREALVWIRNLCLTHIEHATQHDSFRSLAGRVYGKALQALGELENEHTNPSRD